MKKLYNVIVENENVSKQILQNGQLKQRTTFIPLNKISSNCIEPDIVRKAKNLVGENCCRLALDLVEYPPELEKAMKFVFGNTFVCTDMDVAKKVTFHPDIMKRSVTYQGEIFDPQGTLTGGARKEAASLLKRMQDLVPTVQELEQKRRRIHEIEQSVQATSNSANEWRSTRDKLGALQRDVETAKAKLESTTQHQQLEEIRRMEEEIKSAEEILEKSGENRRKAEQRIKELEDRMRNADKYLEKETKEAEKRLKEAKKRAEESSKLLKEKHEGTETLKLEIQDLEVAIEATSNEISDLDRVLETIKKAISALAKSLEEAKAVVKEVESRVSQRRDALRARSKEITDRQNSHDTLVKEIRKAELLIKQLQQNEEKLVEDKSEDAKKLDQMLHAYNWIRTDERFFGQVGTAYDFAATDAKGAAKKLQNAQERRDELQRTVNTRAMSMLGDAEEQYNRLIKNKEIVLNDKAKISAVINELDEKKRQAIVKAWEQVNKDFGSIFSTLLPGAVAKLEPPQGQSPLDGLEVRVGFGDVWKDSLAELSGGQRSLVALSLILAMLLFKPAPIYILDEVDAALDLSHTQNIGHMLRTHFKHSQFIVVSLKDGMFNNANVLFRTKFVDGCSTVTRHVQHQ